MASDSVASAGGPQTFSLNSVQPLRFLFQEGITSATAIGRRGDLRSFLEFFPLTPDQRCGTFIRMCAVLTELLPLLLELAGGPPRRFPGAMLPTDSTFQNRTQ